LREDALCCYTSCEDPFVFGIGNEGWGGVRAWNVSDER